MRLIVDELNEIISSESAKLRQDKKVQEVEELLSIMKKTGLLKKPSYDLPLVDTIGKTYYSSINKHTHK